MSDSTLMLVSASATGVLGEYQHEFKIADNDEFVIIYGPNGVGKTKFLEIVNALSDLRGFLLCQLPFDEATLRYSDGSTLSALRRERDSESLDGPSALSYGIQFILERPMAESFDWDYHDDDFVAFLRHQTRYVQVGEDYWEDPDDGELIHTEGLRGHFGRTPRGRKARKSSEPEGARDFVKRVPSYLIETQRLRTERARDRNAWNTYGGPREQRKSTSRITDQATNIRSLLTEAQTEHSRITQRLDRTFPNRVLRAVASENVLRAVASENSLDADRIRARYDEQNVFRSRLARVAPVSLDDEFSLPESDLGPWELTLLNQYLEDAEQKLAPFQELLAKIELLEKIINDRLLNKQLQVTDGEGLSVRHTQADRDIALDSLSSGEQHEIILMIDLLFNVPKGAVVLIDEPEISLHVAWQIAFIPDVERIATLAGFRFVVATHSPQIINDQWERATRLGPSEAAFH